jgi:hypothetical protein
MSAWSDDLRFAQQAEALSLDPPTPEFLAGWMLAGRFEEVVGCAGGMIGTRGSRFEAIGRAQAAGRAFSGRLTLAWSGLGGCAGRQWGQVA